MTDPDPHRSALRGASDAFAYTCHGCGRCCHDKVIRVSPYGVARLAEALGRSTTEVLEHDIDPASLTLPVTSSGACRYLDGTRCTVHSGRPLACRLYPLGWVVTPEGEEFYLDRAPHPQTEGVYGTDSQIADYLAAQGARPYQHATIRYEAVLRRMTAAAEVEGPNPGPPPPIQDVDAAVQAACDERRIPVPADLEDRIDLHLSLLNEWLDAAQAPPA
jgi:Fe-S-cluster containining protein